MAVAIAKFTKRSQRSQILLHFTGQADYRANPLKVTIFILLNLHSVVRVAVLVLFEMVLAPVDFSQSIIAGNDLGRELQKVLAIPKDIVPWKTALLVGQGQKKSTALRLAFVRYFMLIFSAALTSISKPFMILPAKAQQKIKIEKFRQVN